VVRILKKEKLVKEQATLISDEDFNQEKFGEIDLLVREIKLLNYRRNRNFHILGVIQGQTYTALYDTKATVNIIPTHLMKDLELEKLQPWPRIVTLGDRSKRKPLGTIKDISIHLPPLQHIVDFLVIKVEEGHESLVILGRQFLEEFCAVIDVHLGAITFQW